jgi:hypothetical protein
MCLLVNIEFLGLDLQMIIPAVEGRPASILNLIVSWIPLVIVIPFVILYYKRLYNEIRRIAEG